MLGRALSSEPWEADRSATTDWASKGEQILADDNRAARRASIDSETVRALLLVNGGGAIALLTLLTDILQNPELAKLARASIWAVFIFLFGVVFAMVHSHLRRVCANQHSSRKPRCSLFGMTLSEPCICYWSKLLMWGSMVSVVVAGVVVLLAGLAVVEG